MICRSKLNTTLAYINSSQCEGTTHSGSYKIASQIMFTPKYFSQYLTKLESNFETIHHSELFTLNTDVITLSCEEMMTFKLKEASLCVSQIEYKLMKMVLYLHGMEIIF